MLGGAGTTQIFICRLYHVVGTGGLAIEHWATSSGGAGWEC
jgi:hypothetical protein